MHDATARPARTARAPRAAPAPRRYLSCIVLAAGIGAALPGCATLRGRHAWGEDATLRPGWHRVRSALQMAAASPGVWAPAALAAVLQIDGMDRRCAAWAGEETPLFGSDETARRDSTPLLRATQATYLVSALAAPSGCGITEWGRNKAAAVALGFGALEATTWITDVTKRTTGRERPDGSDHRSFPSGHASGAAVRTTLAARNARAIFANPTARAACDVATIALAAGCGWARVEGRKHYPSDVLAGYALGRFLGSFVNDAFITPGGVDGPGVALVPITGGLAVTVRLGP